MAFVNRASINPSLVTAGADESGVVMWQFDSAKRSFSSEKCRLGQIRRDVVKVVVSENDDFAYLDENRRRLESVLRRGPVV